MERTPNTATLEVEAFRTTLRVVDAGGQLHRFNIVPGGAFDRRLVVADFQACADEQMALGLGYRRVGDWQEAGFASTWTAAVELVDDQAEQFELCDSPWAHDGCDHE